MAAEFSSRDGILIVVATGRATAESAIALIDEAQRIMLESSVSRALVDFRDWGCPDDNQAPFQIAAGLATTISNRPRVAAVAVWGEAEDSTALEARRRGAFEIFHDEESALVWLGQS